MTFIIVHMMANLKKKRPIWVVAAILKKMAHSSKDNDGPIAINSNLIAKIYGKQSRLKLCS